MERVLPEPEPPTTKILLLIPVILLSVENIQSSPSPKITLSIWDCICLPFLSLITTPLLLQNQ